MNIRLVMGLFASLMSASPAANATTVTSTCAVGGSTTTTLEARLRSALWCFFAGDALAAPTHWFYGGSRQIAQYYGGPITDYTQPCFELTGSILNKSNLYGAGRNNWKDAQQHPYPIIGTVINHGKQDLWSPNRHIHYHATLQAGECTLEAQLARVWMRCIVENHGVIDRDTMLQAYEDFMTRPGSHNDVYASTCHRMFFANRSYRQLPLAKCPDNDGHNVDTIDGLVLPTIISLAVAASQGNVDQASRMAAESASWTRKSPILESYAKAWGRLVASVLLQPRDLESTVQSMAREFNFRCPQSPRREAEASPVPMTACYLESAVPAMLDSILSSCYHEDHSPWQSLLANANAGGENVHRGSCLGVVVGAFSQSPISVESSRLVQGLHDQKELATEIEDFVQVLVQPPRASRAEL